VDLITMAIPFFFLLMGVEHLVGRAQGRRVYRGPDVVADLSLGVMQVLFGVLAASLIVGTYAWLYETHRLFDIAPTAGSWLLIFVGVDFFYYWFHRAAHRVNIVWASHAPHHSSEDYNLAVALRQGPVQPLFSLVFYLPLALVGFPPAMFVTMGAINTLYQFWIHTELIGRLGPLEAVLNTPSHHRVHHGINGRYIDKNHAGIFIVWDRLFGTFEPERERPTYGTVKQLATWNPVRAWLAPFFDLFHAATRAPRLADKLLLWVRPPEWRPAGEPTAPPPPAGDLDLAQRRKHDARPARLAGRYVTIMFIVTMLLSAAFFIAGAPGMSMGDRAAVAAWLTLSFGTLGALLDGRAWAPKLEALRLGLFTPVVLAWLLAS
jgi:alkylglycerol monooxygenase